VVGLPPGPHNVLIELVNADSPGFHWADHDVHSARPGKMKSQG
jgi:hypothetical protein